LRTCRQYIGRLTHSAGQAITNTLVAIPTAIPQPTDTLEPTSSVDVCTDADYDHANVVCKSDDSTVSDLSTGELVWSVSQGTFAKDTITINIDSVAADGSEQGQGSTTDNGQLGYTSGALTLDQVFNAANVAAVPGTQYDIHVGYSDAANGMTQLLGNYKFTCSASS
jgi:hypothetical protein